MPAGLGGPPLQRELPAGHARAGLPGALPLPSRRVCQPTAASAGAPGYTVSRAPPRGEVRKRPRSPPAPLMSAPTHPTFRDRTALASAP